MSLRTVDRMGLLRDLALTLLAHRVDIDSLTAYTVSGGGGHGDAAGGEGVNGESISAVKIPHDAAQAQHWIFASDFKAA